MPPKSGKFKKVTYNFSLWNIWVATTLLKVLLFPAYHSTDFDVHRNWLAITHNLPLKDWYLEATSQWTLDYPPFFAYFEWFLSQFVPKSVIADGCLDIVAKGDYGISTIAFQRTTVIFSEIILFLSLEYLMRTSPSSQKARSFVIASSIVLSPGLFIVDHIHFQYNGMMFGILIFSIVTAKEKRYLLCGFTFAVLLCFKHIFLYLAPAYFIFLLRAYCLNDVKKFPTNFNQLINIVLWKNLLKLGGVVLSVFAICFGPFVYYGVMPNLLARLFPFSRGLTHAYWAPNIWALYSFTDRVLIQLMLHIPGVSKIITRLAPHANELLNSPELLRESAASTKGLVGEVEFFILPNIQPSATFLLTLFYQVMSLIPLFINPTFERFIGSLTLCGYASFLFGWHVHEKAIMLVIIPFTFIVCQDKRLLPVFQALSSAGYVSLFPLLYGSAEWLFKALITFVWCVIYFSSFGEVAHNYANFSTRIFLLDRINLIYSILLIPMSIFVQFMDIEARNFAILKKLEFVRLMIYSVYCALGIVGSWNGLSWLYFLDDTIWVKKDDE
ncbi:unnamed protein product [[Candida] boidinii]|uniref:Alpha-1,3-glucosyltransferase n=1 Tax=Candida boidinii TaxID=5477 RepID=A0A9W6SXM2_CANBO|nr:hypothetical protein B5S30_g2347 [[Candida] boidinii]OWB83326.1 hypothetical protein B5S33_g1955 [[Candida] boidinii]GME66999.1 unnamed protein product [[Candida] boidinii]GMF97602.1 unnamed protein product [[Candida] boidinii]